MEDYFFYTRKENLELTTDSRSFENIEWSNSWINFELDDENSKKRILLIGDSSLRMTRKIVQQITGCPVDLFATSSTFQTMPFAYQLISFFSQTPHHYDTTFVQIGYHSINGMGGGKLQ